MSQSIFKTYEKSVISIHCTTIVFFDDGYLLASSSKAIAVSPMVYAAYILKMDEGKHRTEKDFSGRSSDRATAIHCIRDRLKDA